MEFLESIRIVLVEPSHPGNVGSAARAMKTMGLRDLALVGPERYPHADATALASGAADVLESARVCDSLADAVADRSLILATSARTRRLMWAPSDAREAARRLISAASRDRGAIVFGRERTGLTNEELEACHGIIHIPANPDYSSLNLAAAVQVMCYELRVAALDTMPAPVSAEQAPPASADEMEQFYSHLQRVLLATGFLDPAAPRLLMRRLHRLFQRARPDQNEVNMLRGILSSVERPRSR